MSIQHAVSVGVDPHVDTLSAAAVDPLGTLVWDATVPNTVGGVAGLIEAVGGNGDRRWAIEGSGGLGRLLCDQLLIRGALVSEVPTRLTARLRLRNGFSKSDRLDAVAIARLALSETLPIVQHHPIVEALRVLWGQRDTLVEAQVEAANRLRARLRELDPEQARRLGRLRSRQGFDALSRLGTDDPNPHRQALALAIRLDAQEALDRIGRINQLETQIKAVMPPAGHALTQIQGIGLIGAAAIIANTGDVTRFPSEGHYARYAGTAPLDASSGRQQRHRLNRWGNRALNKVTHVAIVTQLQHRGEAYHYVTRRIAEGKTKQEAIRAAKRHLTRRIYRILKQHPLT
jgi:transposase